MNATTSLIQVRDLGKMFTLHSQGGIRLPVLDNTSFHAGPGDCLVLDGASGTGKSTLLRCLYGNYLATAGSIRVRDGNEWVELTHAAEQRVLRLRRDVIGYVSQFLRVIPRASALDVVAEPLRTAGHDAEAARAQAAATLVRLKVPARLWRLPPATPPGGGPGRANAAGGSGGGRPLPAPGAPPAAGAGGSRGGAGPPAREAAAGGRRLIGICDGEDVRDEV